MKKIIKNFPILAAFLLGIRHGFWSKAAKKGVEKYLDINNPAKLQLGAGQNDLKGWFNTDYFPRGTIYFLDVTKPFPISDGVFDFIYSEHHIEHISYKSSIFLLKEAYRILKPGGYIKISTPDLDQYIKLYALENSSLNKELEAHVQNFVYGGFHNAHNYIPVDKYYKAHFLNDIFFNYEHRFIFNFESLKSLLEHAGFIDVVNCSQKDSAHPEFTNIETHSSQLDRYLTLSVEAKKAIN